MLPPTPPLTSYITAVCLSPRREKNDTPLSTKSTLHSSVRKGSAGGGGVPLQSALSPGHSRLWTPGECKGLSGMSQGATGPVPPSPDARCPETQWQEAVKFPKVSQPLLEWPLTLSHCLPYTIKKTDSEIMKASHFQYFPI